MTRKRTPQDLAVVLHYDPNSRRAPLITGLGERHLAKTVLQMARRWGIPLCENQDLAEQLAALPENSEIPEGLYNDIAVLLAEFSDER